MFEVHYWDPPWQFGMKSTPTKSGAALKYDCMPLPAIQQLPVAAVATPNAALFLWVPSRLKFSHGYTTALAWGFPNYEATIYWEKQYPGRRLGTGFWFRGCVEELLVFTRGSMAPFRCQRPNILHLPVGEHSEKPEEFRKLIEVATGQFSRRRCLEGFARKQVPGWTGIGDKVTGRDIRADLRLLATAAA